MGTTLYDTETPVVQVPSAPATPPVGQRVPVGVDNAATNAGAHQNAGAENALTIYRYPQELASDVQYQNYVMFYVNAREDSAIANSSHAVTGDNANYDTTAQNRINADHAGAALGVATGVALSTAAAKAGAKTLSDQLIGKTPLSVKAATKVIGGGIGAIAGGIAGGTLGGVYGHFSKRSLVKVKDVIALYINNPPSVAYKANWSESDMGYVGAVGSGRISDAPIWNAASGGLELLGRAAASGIPKVAGGPNVKDVAEATSKKVQNPYKEQLFKSMGMRTFSFDYTFLPKSVQESQSVFNILRIFKRNMHPEMDKSKLFLVYPSEFSIVYYFQNGENPYLNKISSCVLTDMSVRFGDDRDFTTFRGGSPTMISLRLTFLELEMLTGERVDDNFNYTGKTYGF
jgi:hypothetical protein